jgi:cell division transport system permease protein
MVLFLIGLLGVVLLNAERLARYVRENIGVTLVLKEDIQEGEIAELQKLLKATDFVKSVEYIDKETAAEKLKNDLGEDFTGFLGYNPLLSSIEVRLYADFATPEKLSFLETKFMEYSQVKEVLFQRDIVSIINDNVKKIGFILGFFSVLLLFIFSALINNTIRISIYSQRFIINTMLLVGATDSFIRAPFIKRSVKYGIIGAMAANLLLLILQISYSSELIGIIDVNDFRIFGVVFLAVLLLGVVISWASTYFAVNKFIRLKFDELFY